MTIDRDQLRRLLLTAVGLAQGVIFWIVYRLRTEDPHGAALLAAIVSFTAVYGLILQFAWTGRNKRRLSLTATVIAPLFALVTLWAWWQVPGIDASFAGDGFRQGTLVVALLIALYILLPFIQISQESGQFAFPYPDLYRHSWNNFFIAAIGSAFAGVFWGLIALWAALFKMIGISFFEEIFFSAPFTNISLAAMLGLGIALGREGETIINTLRRITLTVFRALMPLLAVITLLFLAALPFTGLQPLWDTKSASPLLLSVLILTILFINAVFQDGSGPPPYPTWLRRGVEAMLLVMPIFSGLIFYAIGLRIAQYGLTPDRFYVVLFALITGLYGIGYTAAVIRRSSVWIGLMRPVNIGMSLLVAALAFLVHTPILDPLAWSAANQYNRLAQGKADAQSFDYGALRFTLGRAGYARLEVLAELKSHSQSEIIRTQIASVRQAVSYYAWQQGRTLPLTVDHLIIVTPSGRLPEGLAEKIGSDLYEYLRKQCREKRDCVVFSINLDNDREAEYAFVTPGGSYSISLYDLTQSRRWHHVGEFSFTEGTRPDRATLIEAIRQSQMAAIRPEYQDLKIANGLFRLHRR